MVPGTAHIVRGMLLSATAAGVCLYTTNIRLISLRLIFSVLIYRIVGIFREAKYS